eukprot:TRINITY_DN28689_c0_g1_i2.p1 TRINITY_DN28689_c0_g1~~TRINITY_DN28689_c0_g1_i2.p1  ORF type:complete len:243 (+),score=65.60 TRINITY_DN28689_c0_g1_i2:82-810(+)
MAQPGAGWIRDVDDSEWAALSTTGGCVWRAARYLADFLDEMARPLQLFPEGATVLELGSGAGWLGLTVGRNAPGCRVVLTEQAAGGALDWLRHNIEKGRQQGLPLDGVEAAECDWTQAGAPGQPAQGLLAQHWDVVLGSDLVYDEAGVEMLPRVLRAVIGPATRCFYAHTRHRLEHLDMRFLTRVEREGLAVREVWAPSAPSPPPSPEPLAELFPEMRAAGVLRRRDDAPAAAWRQEMWSEQ